MEAELRKDYPDASIELLQGSGGVFDVVCDGKLIYSKHRPDVLRFPNEGEVSGLVRQEIS